MPPNRPYYSDFIKTMHIAAASEMVILTFGTGGLSASSRQALIDEALQLLDLQACVTLLAYEARSLDVAFGHADAGSLAESGAAMAFVNIVVKAQMAADSRLRRNFMNDLPSLDS